ncbi:DUF916 and DUF3324 domain-containing protein [Weissella koreensis]|uniref:DUF916 and DUF3324 domain-containing protein n=1 Tax=Weissella koreensis TaxID=165096 RepID=UPI0022BA37F1|nr:DUF916 and DUF3324 domain-containing protein [Weissella koreensis]MCZ9310592.1 DUF916 and DUF3324 domain-containing protein [Weissella koreensis]
MNIKKILFSLVTLLIIGGGTGGVVVYADDNQPQAEFTVDGKANEFQTDKDTTYDLKMQPGDETTLNLTVQNLSDEKATYRIAINPAQTSDNVIIEYGKSGNADEFGAKPNIQIRQITEISDTKLTVPSHQNKAFSIKIKMPQKKYDGIVAGGIRVEKITESSKEGITNKFAFVKGLVIHQNDNKVKPKLTINSIKASQYQYLPGVIVKMRNPTNINITELKMDTKVVNDKTGKTLIKKKVDQGSVAPNSQFNYVLRHDGKIPAGKYHFKGSAKDKYGNQWQWNKAFEVKEAVKKETNFKVNATSHWLIILLGVIILLLIIALIWLFILLRRKKEQENAE